MQQMIQALEPRRLFAGIVEPVVPPPQNQGVLDVDITAGELLAASVNLLLPAVQGVDLPSGVVSIVTPTMTEGFNIIVTPTMGKPT